MAQSPTSTKETKKQEFILRDFKGINTQAYRTSIRDEEFAWLENLIPIGSGNMRCLQQRSASLQTIPATANYMTSANINGVDYAYFFCNDGSAYQIMIASPYTRTTVGVAGKFSNSGVTAAQWKNERLMITDPAKGTWSWDGSTLVTLNATVFSVTIDTFGSGYTAPPGVTFTPVSGGAGATATAILGMGSVVVTAVGAGYFQGDVVNVSGGTFSVQAKVKVTSVNGTGGVTGISIQDSGNYTVTTAGVKATTGGFGAGLTVTPTWSVVSIVMTNVGSGYLAAPTVGFTGGGGGTGVSATAVVNSAPSAGTSIAVYSGRVWISNNRTVVFSAPDSYNDWTTSSGGGSFIDTDPTLHNNIVALVGANNYLYIFGVDSINIISDVRVSSGNTIFTNTNLTSYVGSPYANSIIPYQRGVMFMNQSGIYLLYGATPQKISDNLDGLFTSIDFTKPITAGTVTIFNQLCAAFMFTYNDPALGGTARPLIAIFQGGKWCMASQGDLLTLCNGVFDSISGRQDLYLTDGTAFYEAFSSSTTTINTIFETKLWEFGSSIITKQALKAGIEATVPNILFTANVTVDTEYGSNTYLSNGGNVTTWINNLGNTVTWQNNALSTIPWIRQGYIYAMQDVTNFGKYLGMTLTSSVNAFTINAISMEYEDRARW